MTPRMPFRWAFVLFFIARVASAADNVELLGVAAIPGTDSDKSGLTEMLKTGSPHNRLGSMGSGIAYTGTGNRYLMVDDRGPGDGATEWYCRFHTFDIEVKKGAVKPTLISTTLLKNAAGKQLVGSSTAFDPKNRANDRRFDPESIRVGRTGTVFIGEEYGPHIVEFDRDGKWLRQFDVPKKIVIHKPDADPDVEDKENKTGRKSNGGFEGLAITPDGTKLYALLEKPLLQDRGDDKKGKHLRLLELPVSGKGPTREFLYVMESHKHRCNEILAVNDHQFLVIERDNEGGTDAKFKRLFLIDVAGASDSGDIEALSEKVDDQIKPVTKKPFLDLLDPMFGLAGKTFPQKVEGLAFGPPLPDGRPLLLVTTDNDCKPDEPTFIYAFAINAKVLPDFKPQEFAKADAGKWTDLTPEDKPLDAWQMPDELWAQAESVELDPKNAKQLSFKPGKGILVNGAKGRAKDLISKEKYADVQVQAEFMIPKGSNSGIKLMGLYEIQIVDSHGKKELTGNDAGGIYPRAEDKPNYHHIDKGTPPSVNASKPAGEWQTLDITFQAPRFDADGKKTSHAKFVKVILNGQTIHEDAEVQYPTGSAWRLKKETATGPLLLQADHGPVAFRNVRIRPQ